jgi:hypothetical protein
MATLIKGKHKGTEVVINQFCNNWFSVQSDEIAKIVSPTSLEFTFDEIERIISSETGVMFGLYEWSKKSPFRLQKIRK